MCGAGVWGFYWGIDEKSPEIDLSVCGEFYRGVAKWAYIDGQWWCKVDSDGSLKFFCSECLVGAVRDISVVSGKRSEVRCLGCGNSTIFRDSDTSRFRDELIRISDVLFEKQESKENSDDPVAKLIDTIIDVGSKVKKEAESSAEKVDPEKFPILHREDFKEIRLIKGSPVVFAAVQFGRNWCLGFFVDGSLKVAHQDCDSGYVSVKVGVANITFQCTCCGQGWLVSRSMLGDIRNEAFEKGFGNKFERVGNEVRMVVDTDFLLGWEWFDGLALATTVGGFQKFYCPDCRVKMGESSICSGNIYPDMNNLIHLGCPGCNKTISLPDRSRLRQVRDKVFNEIGAVKHDSEDLPHGEEYDDTGVLKEIEESEKPVTESDEDSLSEDLVLAKPDDVGWYTMENGSTIKTVPSDGNFQGIESGEEARKLRDTAAKIADEDIAKHIFPSFEEAMKSVPRTGPEWVPSGTIAVIRQGLFNVHVKRPNGYEFSCVQCGCYCHSNALGSDSGLSIICSECKRSAWYSDSLLLRVRKEAQKQDLEKWIEKNWTTESEARKKHEECGIERSVYHEKLKKHAKDGYNLVADLRKPAKTNIADELVSDLIDSSQDRGFNPEGAVDLDSVPEPKGPLTKRSTPFKEEKSLHETTPSGQDDSLKSFMGIDVGSGPDIHVDQFLKYNPEKYSLELVGENARKIPVNASQPKVVKLNIADLPWYRVDELAEFLKLEKFFIDDLVATEKIKTTRVIGENGPVVTKDELISFLDAHSDGFDYGFIPCNESFTRQDEKIIPGHEEAKAVQRVMADPPPKIKTITIPDDDLSISGAAELLGTRWQEIVSLLADSKLIGSRKYFGYIDRKSFKNYCLGEGYIVKETVDIPLKPVESRWFKFYRDNKDDTPVAVCSTCNELTNSEDIGSGFWLFECYRCNTRAAVSNELREELMDAPDESGGATEQKVEPVYPDWKCETISFFSMGIAAGLLIVLILYILGKVLGVL